MRVMCAIEGCSSIYVSGETPSEQGVRYVCSHHTDEELRAAGILMTERTDYDVHFQTIAFDPDLDGRITIEGGENARKSNGHWMHPLPEKPDLYRSSLSIRDDE